EAGDDATAADETGDADDATDDPEVA
ncbi:DUF2240 domain-containing protein, partial [Halobacteriales archaeon SW_8_68_21]